MVGLEQREDVDPICPHCQQPLRTIWFQEVRSRLGKRYVYLCAQCRKILGLSHRKGFWMG